ncbi:Rapid ALkalinization Factor [Quillaja saponaria]|uniref:Rapid ALkalinization Factor n=1 Tax=Quillaja saponaria TaxID=32244 RepID=A0AAD7QHA8_QUISA|nr:Rapid ALkalinization Factor [Quillaja saponaria]
MSNRHLLILFTMALAMVSKSFSYTISHKGPNHFSSRETMAAQRHKCTGLLGECNEEEEMAMESSSITRRVLAQNRYISYGALKGDNVPCNRRGNSYYNCQRSGRANPYQRGCSTITHCARSSN